MALLDAIGSAKEIASNLACDPVRGGKVGFPPARMGRSDFSNGGLVLFYS